MKNYQFKKENIIIAREKYGTSYYKAGSNEEAGASALKILEDHTDPSSGYIHDPGPLNEWTQWKDFTDEEIANLPKSLRDTAKMQKKNFHEDRKNWNIAKQDWEDAQKALANRDGELALKVLLRRSDGEYEGIDIEVLE